MADFFRSNYVSGIYRGAGDSLWEAPFRPPPSTGFDPQIPNLPIENGTLFTQAASISSPDTASVASIKVQLSTLSATCSNAFSILKSISSSLLSLVAVAITKKSVIAKALRGLGQKDKSVLFLLDMNDTDGLIGIPAGWRDISPAAHTVVFSTGGSLFGPVTDTNIIKFGPTSALYGSPGAPGDRLWCNNATNLSFSGPFTVEGWFIWSSIPTGISQLVGKWTLNSLRSWVIEYNQTDGKLHFIISADGVNSTVDVAFTWTPDFTTWHHIAADFDLSTYRLYIDGVMVASVVGAVTMFPSNGTFDFSIGCAFNAGNTLDYFKGNLEALRITKSALYASDAGFTVPTSPPGAAIGDATLTKQATRAASITTSGVGTIARSIAKALLASASLVLVIVRSLAKIIGYAESPVFSISADFIGGSTTTNQSIGASTTPTMSVVRRTAHELDVLSAEVAQIVKTALHSLLASVTPSPAIIRTVAKAISQASDPLASMVRSIGHAVAVQANVPASIIRAAAHSASAVISATAILARQAVSTILASETSSPTVTRLTGRIVPASSAPTFSIPKSTSRSATASASGAASISRSVARVIGATADASAALLRGLAKALNATATGAASASETIRTSLAISADAGVAATLGRTVAHVALLDLRVTASVTRGAARIIAAVALGAAGVARTFTRPVEVEAAGSASVRSSRTFPQSIGALAGAVATAFANFAKFFPSLLRLSDARFQDRSDAVEMMDRAGEVEAVERAAGSEGETRPNDVPPIIRPASADEPDRHESVPPIIRGSDV